jgi:putrescine transport system substrate-binding protein
VLYSPETAETILSVGHSNYDIVTMNASPELAREIPKGFWRKLDQASIPNARNADPQIMQSLKSVDPGNQYAVPWMWGTTGLIYNSDKIKAIMPNAPFDSLDMILKKDIAAKFAGCGISMLDSWGDVLPMVSRYIGQPRLSAARRVQRVRSTTTGTRRSSRSAWAPRRSNGLEALRARAVAAVPGR